MRTSGSGDGRGGAPATGLIRVPPSVEEPAARPRAGQAAREALADARDEARRFGRAADGAEREARRLRADAYAAEREVAEARVALAKLT